MGSYHSSRPRTPFPRATSRSFTAALLFRAGLALLWLTSRAILSVSIVRGRPRAVCSRETSRSQFVRGRPRAVSLFEGDLVQFVCSRATSRSQFVRGRPCAVSLFEGDDAQSVCSKATSRSRFVRGRPRAVLFCALLVPVDYSISVARTSTS